MEPTITTLGVDAGGTFTDYHALDRTGRSHTGKVNSTPGDPSRSIRRILDRFTLAEDCRFIHGTTVATNALLEDELSDFVFVTNAGLEGLLDVGRGVRRDLYDLNPDPREVLAFDQPVVGVDLRDHPEEPVTTSLDAGEAQRLRSEIDRHDPDVVAVCLVHAYRDGSLEQTVREALDPLGVQVVCSSEVLPRFREYERASTTAVTAGLRPLISRYLRQLSSLASMPGDRFVMGSNRGTLSFDEAIDRPALTALSGPAGGIIGARNLLEDRGVEGLITMDIGGTSTDVSLIRDRIPLTDEHEIGGYTLAFPMVDVHTIGSGGGSVIWTDRGGHLRVGPESAGADPGPACYGEGGPPTLTDAQLLLGRIPRDRPLSEDLSLHPSRSEAALAELGTQLGFDAGEVARGALRVARSKLVEAIRKITVRRGHRPSRFSLMGFGGAGGLFAAGVAEALNIESVYVPRQAGVASASGLLTAPRYVQRTVSPVAVLEEDDAGLPGLEELSGRWPDWSQEPPDLEAECRFVGQTHTLTLDLDADVTPAGLIAAFRRTYRDRFGYRPGEDRVELVHLNASWRREFGTSISRESPGSENTSIGRQPVTVGNETVDTAVLELESLGSPVTGPVVLSGATTTLFVPPDWTIKPVSGRFVEMTPGG